MYLPGAFQLALASLKAEPRVPETPFNLVYEARP
jgi:hypothetical protein